MKNLISKNILLITALVLNSAFAAEKPKKTATPKVEPIVLKILLGKESLDLKIHKTETAKELQEFFGKDITMPFGADEKETLVGYKGLDEQTQRQMLCADINDTVDLLAAESEATTVSKIDAKSQKKILMLKILQEQVALTWADKHFFGKGAAKVTAKEIRDTMRVELPLSLGVDEVKEYFCSPNALNKVSDC